MLCTRVRTQPVHVVIERPPTGRRLACPGFAGSGHSLAVSALGALFTWGQGYNGRLGHGNQETKPQPALVEGLLGQRVASAVAGSEFTICATDEGACSDAHSPLLNRVLPS